MGRPPFSPHAPGGHGDRGGILFGGSWLLYLIVDSIIPCAYPEQEEAGLDISQHGERLI